MDGVELKLASMSMAEADALVKEGNELSERMKRGEVKTEEWLGHRNRAVIRSIVKAGAEMNEARLKEEFDLIQVEVLYDKVLDFSGLKPGGAAAVSPLPKSEAA